MTSASPNTHFDSPTTSDPLPSVPTSTHEGSSCLLDSPLISICMTAYRRPTMALQSLLGCIAQSYRPLEIDVSDDSPTDDTERAIRSVVLPQGITLRYRRNHPSLGEPDNVNSLFMNARGTLCVLIHDDDVLLPNALSDLYLALSSEPSLIAAFGLQAIIRNNGELDPEQTRQTNLIYNREPKYNGLIADSLLSALRRQFPNNGYLIRTSAARATLYRSRAEVGLAGDTNFGIRLGLMYPKSAFIFTAKFVSQYRLTDGSASTMAGKAFKLFEYVKTLEDLNPHQELARVDLLQRLSHQTVTDYAVEGSRLQAIRILFSRHYKPLARPLKTLYHVVLISVPRIYPLSRFIRTTR